MSACRGFPPRLVACLAAVFLVPPGAVSWPPRAVQVVATGDLLLAGALLPLLDRHGGDYPFVRVRDRLRGADVAVGNLEVPLTRAQTPTEGKDPRAVREGRDYVFRAPPTLAGNLQRAGFDVLSLANNHAMDYGAEGLLETVRVLRAAGIRPVGAGRNVEEATRAVVWRPSGVELAFLAASQILPVGSVATDSSPGIAASRGNYGGRDWRAGLLQRVRAHAAAGRVVVVSVHWGTERASVPDGEQVELAAALAAHGAHAVLGHHPHVLQGMAWVGRTFVAYSLGNFVATPSDRRARESVIATLWVTSRGVQRVRVEPIWIDAGQPRPLEGEPATRILTRLDRMSRALGAAVSRAGEVVPPRAWDRGGP
jgi:poly-gamma-glutamate capsule biosynthesis protein CapA/YwtB (metallophosphatase superfamily)